MVQLSRRNLLTLAAAFAVAPPALADTLPKIHVAKDAGCGCCNAWIGHVRDAGFPVSFEEMERGTLESLKQSLGLTPEQFSCHTALVDDYVIEGHVPAADIRRLLDTRPDVIGLTVPGMPYGSPGMGSEDSRDAYDVLLVRRDGSLEIFTSYQAA